MSITLTVHDPLEVGDFISVYELDIYAPVEHVENDMDTFVTRYICHVNETHEYQDLAVSDNIQLEECPDRVYDEFIDQLSTTLNLF